MAPATRTSDPRHDTLIHMPGKGTTKRTIRVDVDLWDRAGRCAQAAGTDRATVIKEFLRWYSGEPDAERPTRPDDKEGTAR